MARREVHCAGHVAATPEAVWAIARDFGGAWHPAITVMRTGRGQGGAVERAFAMHGEDTLYRERLTWFSDTDRSMAYTHLEGIEGVQDYRAGLTVSARQGGSTITMTAAISAPSPRAGQIAAGTKAIFDEGIAALAQLAMQERQATDPAPALDPAPVETIMIDGAPRLAVMATPARAGPLCLFLHGIGGGAVNWLEQLRAVGPHMRAAALDLRGYGGSAPGTARSTVEGYCADILRVRAALGADRLILCGLSYGSWIATSFAMRRPGLLAGLVLSGGCTGMSEADRAVREAFLSARMAPLDAGQTPADLAPGIARALLAPDAGDDARRALLDSMAAIPAETYRDALACFTSPPERFDFARLDMPVLMMTGAHDRLAPPDEIRGVARRIHVSAARPDVRFEVIDGAGHVCNLERPEAYNRVLLDFLGRLDG